MDPKFKPIITFMAVALAVIAISIPLILRRIPPNIAYGFRFKKAFKSDENWYLINEYGGRCFVFSGLITILFLGLLFLNRNTLSFWDIHRFSMIFTLAPLAVSALLTALYAKKL